MLTEVGLKVPRFPGTCVWLVWALCLSRDDFCAGLPSGFLLFLNGLTKDLGAFTDPCLLGCILFRDGIPW